MARIFGDRPAGAVAIVEEAVSRSYARKARLSFFVVTAAVATVTSLGLASTMHFAAAAVVGVLSGLVCGLAVAVLVFVWPVLRVLWHWAFEAAAALAVLVPLTLLARASHPLLAGAVALALSVLFLVGPVRRRLVAWGWCAVVRHRLRLCFAEFLRTPGRLRAGSLPLILAARPTPAGERVWVWLRPGLDLGDLDGKTGKLAVACWASEVRVVRASDRYAALVRVDITRRDPLTGLVASPLPSLIPGQRPAADAGPTKLPALALDLSDLPADLPSPVVPVRRVGGRR
jgi:hypothetical protein